MPEQKPPQPWDYNVIANTLKDYTPPSGAFDPTKRWAHRYNIYFMNVRKKPVPGAKNVLPAPNATLSIESTPKGNGVELLVEYSAKMENDLTRMRINCEGNALLSPVAWETTFSNKSIGGQKFVTFTKTGEVKNGAMLIDGKPARNDKKLGAYTSDWALFAAVQRFASTSPALPMQFDLLQYLEIICEKQTMQPAGEGAVTCRNGEVPFRHYLHYGEAVLPTHYCLDANNRLFMAIDPRRFSILVDEKA